MSTLGHCDINLVRGHVICAWCGVFRTSRYLHISAVFYRISISMHHDDCGWCRHKGWSSVVVMSALGHYGINLVRGHASCAWCGVYGMSRHLHGRVWSRCRCCYHCYHCLRRAASSARSWLHYWRIGAALSARARAASHRMAHSTARHRAESCGNV